MRAEAIVRSLLVAASGVTDIVGQRIFGGLARQDDAQDAQGSPLPLIVYRKLSATHDEGLDPVEGASDFVRAQIEVLCCSPDYEQLKQLGEQVRLALLYQRGEVAGFTLLGIFAESEGPDEYLADFDEHVQALVFRVEHDE